MARSDSYRLFPEGAGRWELISDRVMGGVSTGRLTLETSRGEPCLHLAGDVSLDNNGGFLQLATGLRPDGEPLDATPYRAVHLRVAGDDAPYGLHLRTSHLRRPWQSYRASFVAPRTQAVIELAFDTFVPHRTEQPLDPARLRRLGLISIGEARPVDLWVFEVALVR